MEINIWSGHVRVIEVDGKKKIAYKADAATEESFYEPQGFFENKAVNGLTDKLKG